ncbi:putative F-box/LRR-repeat protein [Quillaja saponaria]|uniref:F-box/LRR-repeat protein n=1 Tax=Quillaja saponaria TaxID=32244 RepID=A0AAD7P9E9_QUISA|nr:putative F-box/LRR-repeat protein [Quillaja saponaria]
MGRKRERELNQELRSKGFNIPTHMRTSKRISKRISKRTSKRTGENWRSCPALLFPQDCWERIFNLFDSYHDLKDLSLVCKDFLSITNRARRTLRVLDRDMIPLFPKLLSRFRDLKAIDLEEIDGDELDDLLHQIANSGLKNLQELDISSNKYNKKCLPIAALRHLGSNTKSLKVFKCTHLNTLGDEDLFAIADSMPELEELCISTYYANNVHNAGMEAISQKLKKLRRIDMSIHRSITEKSLIANFSDFSLEKLSIISCFTPEHHDAIIYILENFKDLISLKVGGNEFQVGCRTNFKFPIESVAFTRSLQELEFYDMNVSGLLCSSIAQASLPLRKIAFSKCYIDSFAVFLSLVAAYPFLESLKLKENCFLSETNFPKIESLTDRQMNDLSQHLSNLRYFSLTCCGRGQDRITSSTLYYLAKNCPLLTVLVMRKTSLGSNKDRFIRNFSVENAVNNRHIQFLNLSMNKFLKDESLEKLTLICRNLKFLHVAGCPQLTEGGIRKVKNYSSNRKILNHWFKNVELTYQGHIHPVVI